MTFFPCLSPFRLTVDGTNKAASFIKGGSCTKKKIKPLAVSELYQYVIITQPQVKCALYIFKTLFRLLYWLSKFFYDSQIIKFLCKAKVTRIQQDDSWCYILCSKCSKKLVQEISSFTCVICDKTNVVGVFRSIIWNFVSFAYYNPLPYISRSQCCRIYNLALSVLDHTDSAAFLTFDMKMAKLTNIQDFKAAQIVV